MYKNKRFRMGNAGISGSQQSKTLSNLTHVPTSLGTINENVTNNNEPDFVGSSNLRKTTSDIDIPNESMNSQDSIMPSQAPSQRRYLSQSYMGRSQSSRLIKRIPSSYYENLLTKCGITLDNPDHICLELDHIAFVNKLRQMMISNPEYPENVQRFLKGFEDSIKDESNLIKLLSGCVISTKENETTLQSQETLVKNFLMIEFLQTDLINIFVDKMKVYAIKDFTESDFAVVPLILSQLKFINHFVNGEMLFTKIFELLAIANTENKIEIIKCLEDVIDSSRHDQAIKKLLDLISNEKELFTVSNIETFRNMWLSPDLQSLLRNRIVKHINNTGNVTLILPFIRFVLNFELRDIEVMREVIVDLRNCLEQNFQQISDSTKTEIFICLRKSFMRAKIFYDIWLKYILNMKAPEDHRPIDLLILVMIIKINDDKTNYISNFIKQKIKCGLFTVDLLESTTKLYPTIFAEYASNFLEIVDSFLKDRDPQLVKFSFMTYRLSFGFEDYDEKLIISKLLRFVNIKSSSVVKMSKLGIQTDISTNALLLLTELNINHKDKMIKNGTMLLRMLERTHDFNLTQYRLVMDLLCSVAYPKPPAVGADALQEHLHMLVTKQVSSCISTTKKQGIIGGVRLIDHLTWADDHPDMDTQTQDSDQTFTSITDMPIGRGRESAEIFQMIMSSSANCAESLGLCFDELSFMLSVKNKKSHEIDKNFLIWLCDSMTTDFYNNFFIEEISDEMQKDLSNLYCINRPEENQNSDIDINSIAINIAGLTLHSLTKNSLSSINILPALINLVKIVHFRRHSGSLIGINAVPGCGILLPKLIDNPSELFDFIESNDDPDKTKKIIDIHYHLSNWFREIINAFACQDDKMIRNKIITRLSHLLKLEDRIRKLLAVSKEYTPPNCHFIHKQIENPLKVPKLPRNTQSQANKSQNTSRKRKHTHFEINSETISNITVKSQEKTINNMKANGKCEVDKNEYGPKEIFRYMDPDIILLLKEKVNLVISVPEENLGNEIGLLELKFILHDLVTKLESFLGIRKDTDEHIAFNISSTDFISDLIQFLPKIMEIFKQITDFIGKNESSGTLITIEMSHTKICFGYILRLLSNIFQWVEFRNISNRNMLKECLQITGNLSSFHTTNLDFKELVLKVLHSVTSFKVYIHELHSAVYLSELLSGIAFNCSEVKTESYKIMVDASRDFLQRVWYTSDGSLEKGSYCNILLDKLVKTYVKNASLSMIQNNLNWILIEINMLKKKNDSLKTFPSFNKLNFPLLFRALCSSFIAAMNEEIHSNNSEPTAKLRTWEKGCKILNCLLEIVKNLNIQRNFVLFLKHAHIYIKLFLQYGMSMLERNLRRIPERTNELLKNFQQTTRYLHNLCCHSKAIQNATIVTQIPFLRQTIELLVFKVKAALAANNCTAVFWMGNLKNKDLQGDEILSQVSCITTQNDEDAADEELPDDDEYNEGVLFGEEDNQDKSNEEDSSRSVIF